MNKFQSILDRAKENKWCTSHFCTTCGATEFRSALKDLGDDLADELAQVDLHELRRTAGWHEILQLTLDEIRKAERMDHVLSAWLPQLPQHIRLADLVLFHYVRRGALFAPMSVEMLQQWREACIDLAVRTRDESLVESLICTLGDYTQYPELAAVVQDLVAHGSRQVIVALRRKGLNTGG